MARQLYSYKQKNNFKTSADITEITPIYWNKLEPGERIDYINYKNLTRMITPILPTMDAPYVDIFAFAVPKRIIIPFQKQYNPTYKGYYTKFTDIALGNLLTNPAHCTLANAIKAEVLINPVQSGLKKPPVAPALSMVWDKMLLNKFGFNFKKMPKLNKEINFDFDLMNLFVYKKIYYDFFRQKQLEAVDYDSFMQNIAQALDDIATSFGIPRLGIANLSILGTTKFYAFDWTDTSIITADNYCARALNTINVANVDNDFLNSLTFNKVDSVFDIAADKLDWNTFKKSVFEHFMQNDKIINNIDHGTQKDVLLKIWNVDNGDKTQVELIGYERYDQSIKQVINQAAGADPESDNGQALGEVGGMSCTYNEGNLINNYIANEETYIMILAVPNYRLAINNITASTEWVRPSDLPNFNPEADYIQEPFYSSSIFADYTSKDVNTILAYQKPFNYYRTKIDNVAGDISTKWDAWTYSIDLPALDEIGLNVMKAQKEPFKNTLVAPTQDAFLMEWVFDANIQRVIKPDYLLADEVVEGEL